MSALTFLAIYFQTINCNSYHLSEFTLITSPLMPSHGSEWATYSNDTTNEIWMLSPIQCTISGGCDSTNPVVISYNINTETFNTETSTPSAFTCFGAHCATAIGNTIYFNNKADQIGSYNIISESWSLPITASFPNAVENACLTSDNRFVYVISGRTGSTYHNYFQIYDTQQGDWLNNIGYTPDTVHSARVAAACQINNGTVYLFGGRNASNALDSIESIYVGIGADVISNINTASWIQLGATLNIGKYGLASTLCNNIDKEYIYLIGGYDLTGGNYLDVIEVFNMNTKSVTTLGFTLKQPRYAASVSCVNQYIFVMGGQWFNPGTETVSNWEISNPLYTLEPTTNPTYIPTNITSKSPTNIPTRSPTDISTTTPSNIPTNVPSVIPTSSPASVITDIPTTTPSNIPSKYPTYRPITAEPTIPNQITAVPIAMRSTLYPPSISIIYSTNNEESEEVGDRNDATTKEGDRKDEDLNDTVQDGSLLWIIIGVIGLLILLCICFALIVFKQKRAKRKDNTKNVDIGMYAISVNSTNTNGYMETVSCSPSNMVDKMWTTPIATVTSPRSNVNGIDGMDDAVPNNTMNNTFGEDLDIDNEVVDDINGDYKQTPLGPSSSNINYVHDDIVTIKQTQISDMQQSNNNFGVTAGYVPHNSDQQTAGYNDNVIINDNINKDEFVIHGDDEGGNDQIFATPNGQNDHDDEYYYEYYDYNDNNVNNTNNDLVINGSGDDEYQNYQLQTKGNDYDVVWNEYINIYGYEPQNAFQLQTFSKSNDKYKDLSFKEARKIFNNKKSKVTKK